MWKDGIKDDSHKVEAMAAAFVNLPNQDCLQMLFKA